MKLNPDCVRHVLLVVEELSNFDNFFCFPKDWPKDSFDVYSAQEIRYHIEQCFASGLLLEAKGARDLSMNIFIQDLSPAGHKLLADIRPENNWTKIKKILSKAGTVTLKLIESVASGVATGVATAFLKDKLNL